MASVDQGDRNSRFSGSKTLFLLTGLRFYIVINQDQVLQQNLQKCRVRKSNSAHRSPFVTTNFPSSFLFNLKCVPRIASFILTRKYLFIVSFLFYILLSRYSNNRNLKLCLLIKYLHSRLVF